MAKVMRKEARHTQRRDQASGVPLEILEHLPPSPEPAYPWAARWEGAPAADAAGWAPTFHVCGKESEQPTRWPARVRGAAQQ